MNFDELFHDAVDDVEPNPGLDAIRSRIEEAPAMDRRWIAPLAGAAAVAAVVLGFVALQGPDDKKDTGGPLGTPTQTISPTPTPSPSETEPPAPSSTRRLVPVYYAGDTPVGPRLYREFRSVECFEGCSLPGLAIGLAVNGKPADPDYRTLWPDGSDMVDVTAAGDLITVNLTGDLHDRPGSMSAEEARLAVQQLVYTAQGTVNKGRLPVQFLLDGKHTDTLLGVPVSEPLSNDSVLDTLSLVSLTSPTEGQVVTGDELQVSGVANSFEATVGLRLQRYEGTEIVWQGSATASECCGDKLFPFSTSIDVSGVAPGRYILMASTDVASDEGPGPFTDTRVIEIR